MPGGFGLATASAALLPRADPQVPDCCLYGEVLKWMGLTLVHPRALALLEEKPDGARRGAGLRALGAARYGKRAKV